MSWNPLFGIDRQSKREASVVIFLKLLGLIHASGPSATVRQGGSDNWI